MIKQYIKQALRMIGENKLLSVISILGTALAICMIMVIVILYVVNTASFKPEVNRGRTCYITTVMSNGKDDNRRISYSSLGLPLVKECCYPLKGAEAVTAINMDRYRPLTASSMDGLKNRTSYISYTDTAFWKIFQFDFQQGGPFSPAAAVRQEIYITNQGSRDSVAYRIGGVCEKQRYCEFTGYDYAYYKLVDENKVAEEGDWVGEGLNTFIRVKPGADGAAFATNFRKEMEQQLRVGNIYLKDVFPMSHYRDQFLERWLDQVRLYVAGIAFFLLNVLLGVVGTFWYRTQQRSAEIGLRMAMGATRKGIFWQLVKEGLALLTIAFIPSAVIFANLLHMEVTQGSEIPPDMASRLLFGFVFSYAVMAAMIVVGISFPSYRAMRMHPADALRQE